jgi:hypothetical protein
MVVEECVELRSIREGEPAAVLGLAHEFIPFQPRHLRIKCTLNYMPTGSLPMALVIGASLPNSILTKIHSITSTLRTMGQNRVSQ